MKIVRRIQLRGENIAENCCAVVGRRRAARGRRLLLLVTVTDVRLWSP